MRRCLRNRKSTFRGLKDESGRRVKKCSAVGPTVRSGTDCSNKWQLMKNICKERCH